MALNDPELFGMGTTTTLTCSLGWDMIIGHVGDSRAYLLRAGQFKRLTRDHTVVQGLIEQGVISPTEVAKTDGSVCALGTRDEHLSVFLSATCCFCQLLEVSLFCSPGSSSAAGNRSRAPRIGFQTRWHGTWRGATAKIAYTILPH